MVVKKNITIELKEDEVKKIIAHYLDSHESFKVKPEDVILSVDTKMCKCHGIDKFEAPYFKCAIIKVET